MFMYTISFITSSAWLVFKECCFVEEKLALSVMEFFATCLIKIMSNFSVF